ncbi:MAG: phenylacetate--CoA ligase family protein [Aeromicrobium sp.]
MANPPGELRAALDMLRAQREGVAGLARRQESRLAALVAHARAKSRFYERLYRDLPADRLVLRDLPPVTKPQLMAAFDAWVTDPGVTRAGVEAFVADPALIGSLYRGRYYVCSTSGTTGHPGLFLHDRGALSVYRAVSLRIDVAWLSGRQWWDMARHRLRWATVVGTGGHFAGEGWIESERRRSRWRRRALRVFSVQQPLPELVTALNAFDPAILTAYPSAMKLLADEQAAGRLHVRPVIVELGGESTSHDDRDRVSAALGGALHDAYGASEFSPMAFDCAHGWLHVNSDWVILEPVDADYRPTPPGEQSHTALLTNLANRVQPVIRYDLGDSVLAKPEPCPCGSPLPAIRVTGRRDDVLHLDAADGHTVSLLPLAIGSVVDDTAAVHRSQLIQTGPTSIRLRLEAETGADAEQMWRVAAANLNAYLVSQGLADVELVRASEPPQQSVRSGKFRQVIAGSQAAP